MRKATRSIVLCFLACVVASAMARPSYAQGAHLDDSVSAVLETRIAFDADSCPAAVEVWLVATADTIQALQLVVAWDRPDFARFATERITRPRIDTLAPGQSSGDSDRETDSVIVKPILLRNKGLLSNWEYVEARGESGLSVRITAFPYLTAQGDATPLYPSDGGLLFSLPVEILPKPPVDVLGDSASVGMSAEGTLLSNTRGKLIKNIGLRSQSIGAPPCWLAHGKQ